MLAKDFAFEGLAGALSVLTRLESLVVKNHLSYLIWSDIPLPLKDALMHRPTLRRLELACICSFVLGPHYMFQSQRIEHL